VFGFAPRLAFDRGSLCSWPRPAPVDQHQRGSAACLYRGRGRSKSKSLDTTITTGFGNLYILCQRNQRLTPEYNMEVTSVLTYNIFLAIQVFFNKWGQIV
jgi:hypothetical protein